jgi:hypothetical protein
MWVFSYMITRTACTFYKRKIWHCVWVADSRKMYNCAQCRYEVQTHYIICEVNLTSSLPKHESWCNSHFLWGYDLFWHHVKSQLIFLLAWRSKIFAKIFEIDASHRNVANRLKKILLPSNVVPDFMLCKKMVSSNFCSSRMINDTH